MGFEAGLWAGFWAGLKAHDSCDAPYFGGHIFFFFIQEFNVPLFYIPKIYETILF